MDFLSGYKTYIVAALVGVTAAVHQLGYIDADMMVTIIAVLGGGGLAALRSGIDSTKTQ